MDQPATRHLSLHKLPRSGFGNMNTFLILAIAVGVATADVSHLGYNYKVPQTSYGVPTYQVSSSQNSFNSGYNTGLSSNQGQYLQSSLPSYSSGYGYESFGSSGLGSNFGSAGSNFGSAGSNFGSAGSNFGSAGSNFGSAGSNFGSAGSNFGSAGSSFDTTGSSFGSAGSNFGSAGSNFGSEGSSFGSSDLSSLGFGSSYGTGGLGSSYFESSTLQPSFAVTGSSQFGSSNQFQSSNVNKYQEKYEYVTQPPQVFKHFYVHAAPEEPEIPKPKQPIVLPPPQKHYKIIFIKAPSQNYAPPVIPVQQHNEEKTIVYVLVKKPEDAQNIVLPKFETKPPTKPEVFFIKYNNKDGSQAVINNIVNDYNKGGASVNYNAGEQQAIVTGGNYNFGSSGIGSSALASGALSSFESSSSSGIVGESSYGVTSSPIVSVSTVDNGSSAGEFTSGSAVSTASSAITGGFTESSSQSPSNYENSNLISTSQGVPHESYGTPKFRD